MEKTIVYICDKHDGTFVTRLDGQNTMFYYSDKMEKVRTQSEMLLWLIGVGMTTERYNDFTDDKIEFEIDYREYIS